MSKVIIVLLMFICISVCRCTLRRMDITIAGRTFHLAFIEASGIRVESKWTPEIETQTLGDRLGQTPFFPKFHESKEWFMCAFAYMNNAAQGSDDAQYLEDTNRFSMLEVRLVTTTKAPEIVTPVELRYAGRKFGQFFFRHDAIPEKPVGCRYTVKMVSEETTFRVYPSKSSGFVHVDANDISFLPTRMNIPPPGDIPPAEQHNGPALPANNVHAQRNPPEDSSQGSTQPAQHSPAYTPRVNNSPEIDEDNQPAEDVQQANQANNALADDEDDSYSQGDISGPDISIDLGTVA